MVTRGRDRLTYRSAFSVRDKSYHLLKSTHQRVIVTEMLSDSQSIDVYQLSDSTEICVPAECQALLAEMGWLQALYRVYTVCFLWNDIFIVDIWYQDTIIYSVKQVAINTCTSVRSVSCQLPYSWCTY